MTATSAEFLSLCPTCLHLTLSPQLFESSRQTSLISHFLTSLFQSSCFDNSLLLSQTLTMLVFSEEMALPKVMRRIKCFALLHLILLAKRANPLSKIVCCAALLFTELCTTSANFHSTDAKCVCKVLINYMCVCVTFG